MSCMHRLRELGLTLFAALFAALVVGFAPAQAAWPERPIQIIVPYAAGGGSDVMTRLIAKVMASQTGHAFVVENRPGAGGIIGTVAVARAKPDGYTLLLVSPATHGINPYLYRNPGYDPIRDFTLVGQIGNSAMILFANAALPASNLKELIALVKSQPGKYAYGSPGAGTQHHLGMEQLKFRAGLDMPHVAYKGAGPAMTDLVAGHLPLMIGGFGPAAAYLAQGKIKVIGSANSRRQASAKDVPLFAETVNGVGVGSWVGLGAPAGTPLEVVQTLGGWMAKAMTDDSLKQGMSKIGVDVEYLPGDAFGRIIATELPLWKEAIEPSGAKAD